MVDQIRTFSQKTSIHNFHLRPYQMWHWNSVKLKVAEVEAWRGISITDSGIQCMYYHREKYRRRCLNVSSKNANVKVVHNTADPYFGVNNQLWEIITDTIIFSLHSWNIIWTDPLSVYFTKGDKTNDHQLRPQYLRTRTHGSRQTVGNVRSISQLRCWWKVQVRSVI